MLQGCDAVIFVVGREEVGVLLDVIAGWEVVLRGRRRWWGAREMRMRGKGGGLVRVDGVSRRFISNGRFLVPSFCCFSWRCGWGWRVSGTSLSGVWAGMGMAWSCVDTEALL